MGGKMSSIFQTTVSIIFRDIVDAKILQIHTIGFCEFYDHRIIAKSRIVMTASIQKLSDNRKLKGYVDKIYFYEN